MLRSRSAIYLAVALTSTALATVQPERVPEAEAMALFGDDAAVVDPVCVPASAVAGHAHPAIDPSIDRHCPPR